MAAKSTNTKKSSTNNTAKAAKNATTKKTSTTKKASASTKKSSGSKTKRTSNHINTAQSQEIRSEILLLGSLAICILLILSNFGMGGIAGGAISSVGFGLVGAMAYLFPFVFFGAVAFYISNKGKPHAYIKVGAAIVLVILLCGILELMFHPYTAGTSVLSHYNDSSADNNAGDQYFMSTDRRSRYLCYFDHFLNHLYHSGNRTFFISPTWKTGKESLPGSETETSGNC